MLFQKETILLVALLPLTLAAAIMHTYMKTYYSSCFEDWMTLRCSIISGLYAIAVITALAINLCQIQMFDWLQRFWFFKRGHKGMRAFGFCSGAVWCIPLTFAKPITNPVICAAFLMVVWGFLMDIANDLDLGLSGLFSGMLVSIGIVHMTPTMFPTSREDDVGWLIALGLMLVTFLWSRRKLNVVQPSSNDVDVNSVDMEIHLKKRLEEETKRAEEACRKERISQLKRNDALLKKYALESALKQRQKDLDNKGKERVNLLKQLDAKNAQIRNLMREIKDFNQYLTRRKEQNQDRQSSDSVVMDELCKDILKLMKRLRDTKQALSQSRQAEQLVRAKLSGLEKETET